MADLLTEPCQTQRSALQGRKVSSRELLAATFARIDAINPLVNAVIAEDRATAQIAADESLKRCHRDIAVPYRYAPIDGAHRFIEARKQKDH